jgi:glycolate oxidase subunit GlcD
MLSKELIGNIKKIVGEQHVSLSGADAEIYSYDASLVKGKPDIVAFPATTGEIAQISKLVYEAGVPFLARGFGTNLSGGSVPLSGGLVISLARMNKILDIELDGRYAVVQPGVTNLELQNALAPLGFFYAPDPASQKVATLGGNLAENSGGPRCVKYGVTTNHILGMEFVLPDGEVVHLGGPALDPPGYDLRGLAVGSEGTFGIATEITVRILPKAEKIISMLVVYDQVSDAAKSVSGIVGAGIVPATLEMMDSLVIQAVEDSYACGYPRDAAAVLIIEVEGPPEGLTEQADSIREICGRNHCREIKEAQDENERNLLWEGRRGAFGAIARLAPNYLVNDCTVPRTKLPQALESVAEISKKYGFRHGNVFHAGDGNLHPLLFFDSRVSDELDRVKQAGWEIMARCVELGGTISGEHGIGLEKLPAMRLIQSEDDFDVQRRIKAVFDPKNLLNPGKVIPETDETHAADQRKAINAEEQEIAEKIKQAAATGSITAPVGLGNHLINGITLPNLIKQVNTLNLSKIVEYDAASQTVTTGAGMSLTALQQSLQTENQWLPVIPPFSHRDFTLGGLIATGACGPERISYGAPRDLLLGLRYVDSAGRIISAGGKVIKNVAGYDLTRLLAGSSGTLGCITEVTLKVSALPEKSTCLIAVGDWDACCQAATQLNKSNLQPVFTVSYQSPSTTESDWIFQAGFAGFKKSVLYQLSNASRLAEDYGLELENEVEYPVQKGIFYDFFKELDERSFIIKADLPPNKVWECSSETKNIDSLNSVWADHGCGRIYIGGDTVSIVDWERVVEIAEHLNGHAVIHKAPLKFLNDIDGHRTVKPEEQIMNNIKASLDPGSIFAPGLLPVIK